MSGGPYTYDVSGNLITDGNHTYTYDAENRIASLDAGSVSYLYDANGDRAEKTVSGVWTDFIHDLSGNHVTEVYAAGWGPGYVYLGGKLLAEYKNSTTYFVNGDHLGSTRLMTQLNQSIYDSMDYQPFGEQIAGNTGSTHKFTGKERDAESGLDYFGARYFGSSMGRMMSPDPIGGDMTNPQSLNKYAYALNNPLRYTDPTGLYVCATGQDCSAFEKSLDALRNSKNGDVARAAGAYGALGDKNGVTVGFADLSKQGEDGKVTSSLGTDANGNLQAQSNVTINTGATGAAFDAAIGHEGSHVADAQDVVKSIVVDPKTGDFTVGNNITRYQSEQRAYGVTNSILSSEGVNANEGCMGCDLGRSTMQGQVPGIVDRIMNTGNNYMSGGKHMGPKNQGGSVVNGVDQTPKAAVPQVPH